MKEFIKSVFASMFGFLLAQTLLVFGFIFLIGILIGIASSTKSMKVEEIRIAPDKQKVLHLELDGALVERIEFQDLFMYDSFSFLGEKIPLGLFEIEQSLKKAAEDKTVKGIYIKAGSLNAGWAGLVSLREALQRFKKSGKFIYAYGDYFSEKTYFVSSIADTIFMYPEGSIEINGFASVLSFFKETLNKLEVEPQIFRAGNYKSAVEVFLREDMSDENREQIRVYNRDAWSVFNNAITASRKLPDGELNQIANNLDVSSAKQALQYKLVDQLKFPDEIESFLKGVMSVEKDEKIPFVSVLRYPQRKKRSFAFGDSGMSQFEGSDASDDGTDKVAIVFADGEIHMGRSEERSIGERTMVEAIRSARENENVKAVVIRVNSPGGQALAADKIWREVFITNKVKPVIASFGDISASGGYYLSAAAQKVFAQPTTLTGSIGVFGLSFVTKDLFKNKLGITFDKVVTHPSADMGFSHRLLTESERKVMEGEVDRVYGRFLDIVHKGRKMSLDEARKIAGGRVWSGWSAKQVKLIDEMGGLPAAIEAGAKAAKLNPGYRLEVYPKTKLPFGQLFKFMSARVKAELGFGFSSLSQMDWQKEKYQNRTLTLMPFQIRTH